MREKRTSTGASRVGVAAIVGVALAAQAVIWSIAPELPNPVASHWGLGWEPNGFSSVGTVAVIALAIGLVLPLLMLLLGVGVRAAREMSAFSVGLATLIQTQFCVMLWTQRGLSDARQATGVGGGLVWGLVAGVATGLLTWFLVRRRGPLPTADRDLPVDGERLEIGSGATVAWTGSTRVSRSARALGAAGLGVLAVMVVVFVGVQDWGAAAFIMLLALLIGFLLGSMWCDVTVDSRGVQARGLFRMPWVRVPLSNIAVARVDQVRGLGDFGGYGIRHSIDGRRKGLVTSDGEALLLERVGMPDHVLTVDDAQGAARVLNTLLSRQRAGDSGGIVPDGA